MKVRAPLASRLGLFAVALIFAAASATAQTLTASPAAVNFEYSANQKAPEPVVVAISGGTGTTPALMASVTPAGATPAGLFVVTVSSSNISVGIDVGTLNSLVNQPGLYMATMTVTASGFSPLIVPVSLFIGGTFVITSTPASLSFDLLAGPTSQTVTLTGNSSSEIGFTFVASTTSGGNWLTVTSNSGYTPAAFTVTANPGTLPLGSYSGSIVITPNLGSPITIPVTLSGSTTGNLSATPASLTFQYTIGGAVPPAQALLLSSIIPNNTYTAVAGSAGNFLLINGVTAPGPGDLPATLNVTVSPAGLVGGSYLGSITVTGGDGSTLSVPVTLFVNGAGAILVNPTSLSFAAQVGGAPPASQIVYLDTPPSTPYSTTVASAGNWLAISANSATAPAQLTVTANPGSLAAGSYTGSITVNIGPHTQIIQCTLTISPNPVVITNPGSFISFYAGGSSLPPETLNVNVSSGPPQKVTVSGGGATWLQFAGGTATTPFGLIITVNPTGLASGAYVATILLTPSGPGAVPVSVPVLLVVTGSGPIVASPTTLSFNATAGGAPQSQMLGVTASVPTAFTASATTSTGGNWLAVSPASGTASTTSTSLTVTADPSALATGTYHGTITLTTSTGIVTQVPVTFSVGTGGFSVSPATLSFTYTQGGALPTPQTVQVTTSGSFTATASTTSGGEWLSVTPASATGNTNLTVVVNPAGLAGGVYSGSVTVTSASGTPATVAVTLTVTSLTTTGLAVSPASLSFFFAEGGSTPAAQTLSVTSMPAVAFTAATTSSGWLSVSPASATTPASLTVAVNPAGLNPGSYTGMVTLSAPGATQVTVSVYLTVAPGLPSITSVLNAASYAGGGHFSG